jgi:hypothetical protein
MDHHPRLCSTQDLNASKSANHEGRGHGRWKSHEDMSPSSCCRALRAQFENGAKVSQRCAARRFSGMPSNIADKVAGDSPDYLIWAHTTKWFMILMRISIVRLVWWIFSVASLDTLTFLHGEMKGVFTCHFAADRTLKAMIIWHVHKCALTWVGPNSEDL